MEGAQVQRLRRGFDAWNRRAWDEALEFFSPDVIWRTGGFFPGLEPIYEGHEGLLRFFNAFVDPWEEVSVELENVVDDRPGQTLPRVRFQARGREGIEVDATFFQLWRFDEDGLVVEFEGYQDEAEARGAAGLTA